MNSVLKVLNKVTRWARGLLLPRPNLYDLCLAGFLGIVLIRSGYRREVYFIFYIIFLISLSIGLRPKLRYRSVPLMLLTLWGFAGVFIHSFVIYKESITMRYLNMYLLSEGFIYILFGSLFLITTVNQVNNEKIFYVLIPLAMIPQLIKVVTTPSLSFIFSVLLAFIIYFTLSRRSIWLSAFAGGVALVIAKINWYWVHTKFYCRPLVWRQLIGEIKEHPFVGSGWNKTLLPDNMVYVEYHDYGWLYRHNDYLSLGGFLGVIAIIFIVWFLIATMRRIGLRPALIPVLAITILCFFQMTMFWPERAAIYLLITALCIRRTECSKKC